MGKRGELMQAAVLDVLRWSAEPLSAYGILAELRPAFPKIAPPTIYRALAALIDGGHVQRVESLNAFMACSSAGFKQTSILSICDDCGTVEESVAPDFLKQLSSLTAKSGFEPHRHVVEVHGICGACGAREEIA